MARVAIDDLNWAERARFRCPKGLNWWVTYETTWYCRTCRQSYDAFRDTKTAVMTNREDVILKDGYRKR